jgi:hypothetical protein
MDLRRLHSLDGEGRAPILNTGARPPYFLGVEEMETKLWQKVMKITVFALLILANLWVWASNVRGCLGCRSPQFP